MFFWLRKSTKTPNWMSAFVMYSPRLDYPWTFKVLQANRKPVKSFREYLRPLERWSLQGKSWTSSKMLPAFSCGTDRVHAHAKICYCFKNWFILLDRPAYFVTDCEQDMTCSEKPVVLAVRRTWQKLRTLEEGLNLFCTDIARANADVLQYIDDSMIVRGEGNNLWPGH